MMMARAGRMVIQAAYFVALTRCLGSGQYGAFAAVFALVGVLAPFSGMGMGNLLIKHVSRDLKLMPECLGNALLVVLVTGVVLLGVATGVSAIFLSGTLPVALTVVMGVPELLFLRCIDVVGQAYQAIDRLQVTAQLQVLITLAKLVSAIIVFLTMHNAQAIHWAACYLVTSGAVLALALTWALRDFGRPRTALWRIRSEWLEGIHFSIGLASQGTYNDIDKTMLARMVSLDVAGFYAAAYRIVDIAVAPINSVLNATYTAFFRQGAKGIRNTYIYARRFVKYAGAYGIVSAVALFLFAPALPAVMGHGYATAVPALRWIAVIPLFRGVQYFAANTLTGAGYQNIRSYAQLSVAGLNVGLDLWLIPLYTWRGAAWASLASDGLLAIALWIFVLVLHRREHVLSGSKEAAVVG
jgi:O-antigen/teichoic acid export membrane protein